jgi:ABC-type cobalamin/Fe3+-siderophores transport system ATPase subunit
MILQAKNITLTLNRQKVLDDISISIKPGEMLGLIGPNGAGKTSLLRVLANLQRVDQGQLLLNNTVINNINHKTLAQQIGYLAQGAPAHWPLQVRRLIELGRLPYLAPWQGLSTDDKSIVDKAMQLAEVEHLANRVVSTLSGGERLRVLIARMFATQPNIILADEPIAALDPYHQLHTMELLHQHCATAGNSAVVVMHDLNMAARYCHRLVLINHGRVAYQGEPEQVLQAQNLAEVYGIEAQLLDTDGVLTIIPRQRA